MASLSATERRRIRAVVHMDMIASLNSPAPTVLLEGAALAQTVAGVPAVLTIEGTDDANHNIHSAEGTLAHIDWKMALDILRMNVAFVAQTLGQAEGNGPIRPLIPASREATLSPLTQPLWHRRRI